MRRDSCELASGLQKAILQKLFDVATKNRVQNAIDLVKTTVRDLFMGRVDLDQLIITKGLSKAFDDESYRQNAAHVQLAHRLAKRDASAAPRKSDRVLYVMIEQIHSGSTTKGSNLARIKNCMRGEDPFVVLENNLPIDYRWYLDHQLREPVDVILWPVLKADAKLDFTNLTERQVEKKIHDFMTVRMWSGPHMMQIVKPTPKANAKEKNGFMGFGSILSHIAITKQCVNQTCRAPLRKPEEIKGGLCAFCKDQRPQLVLTLRAKHVAAKEASAEQWSTCKTCQRGNMDLARICRSIRCPTLNRRVRRDRELATVKQQLIDIEDLF